ncbi:MAG: DNA mismatch repair protein MutS, partial [Clostridia bacterium]|nr:DNA mismatch repair protein MutS [Clostridia bacterium]
MGLSPMMKQYKQIKAENPDCLLMFRLGDFYELFFEDAKTASRELELVLTGRDCGEKERAPMCGVPYHAVEGYLSKLISKGYRVAICEQLEDPATVKGIVKRDVVRIVSPGTVTEGSLLKEGQNNYLAAVVEQENGYGLAFGDVSTGEIFATEAVGEEKTAALYAECAAFSPSEAVIGKGVSEETGAFLRERMGALLSRAEEEIEEGGDETAEETVGFVTDLPEKAARL